MWMHRNRVREEKDEESRGDSVLQPKVAEPARLLRRVVAIGSNPIGNASWVVFASSPWTQRRGRWNRISSDAQHGPREQATLIWRM